MQLRTLTHIRRMLRSHSASRSLSNYQSVVSANTGELFGGTVPPLINQTIGQVLEKTGADFGSLDAIVVPYQGITKTWTQVKYEAELLASSFVASGVGHGDRIGIWGCNSYQWQLSQFGAALVGAVLVNVNQAYQAEELSYCLRLAGVDTLVAAEGYSSSDYYAILDQLTGGRLTSGRINQCSDLRTQHLPSLRQVVMISQQRRRGVIRFDDFLEVGAPMNRDRLRRIASNIEPSEACSIQFTSGTTGRPKGATLSHYSVLNNARLTAVRAGLTAAPAGGQLRLCVPVPLYHCFGCVLGSLVALLYGHTMVLPAPVFNTAATLQAVQQHKCHVVYGTPTMFVDLCNAPNLSSYDLTSLGGGLTGGAPLSPTLMHDMMHRLNMTNAVVGYGLTETSPLLTLCSPTDAAAVRCGTVGRALPHTRLRLQCPATGGVLSAPRATGVLCSSGYASFIGYWAQRQATRAVFTADRRWLITGDLAEITADGYVKIVGRVSDMVIRGGENIYPAEIENCLMTHPDIAEAYVFGVPDARMGEELCVWIRTKSARTLSTEAVKAFFAGKLAHFKVPRYIQFRSDFPKTVTGKVQKFRMREMVAKELSCQGQ